MSGTNLFFNVLPTNLFLFRDTATIMRLLPNMENCLALLISDVYIFICIVLLIMGRKKAVIPKRQIKRMLPPTVKNTVMYLQSRTDRFKTYVKIQRKCQGITRSMSCCICFRHYNWEWNWAKCTVCKNYFICSPCSKNEQKLKEHKTVCIGRKVYS